MKTSVSVEITPFSVPSFVQLTPLSGIPLPHHSFELPINELPGDALYALCADFETQVWNAAGKSRTVPARSSNTEKPLAALARLQAVLCDPDGKVCIAGSEGDASTIKRALLDLEIFLGSL